MNYFVSEGAEAYARIGIEVLRAPRGWPDDAWNIAASDLQERGWLNESGHLTLTE